MMNSYITVKYISNKILFDFFIIKVSDIYYLSMNILLKKYIID